MSTADFLAIAAVLNTHPKHEHVTRVLLDVNDSDIVLDLQRSNGKPNSTIFDTFWSELQTYLDEINPAVDERRHGETLHMVYAFCNFSPPPSRNNHRKTAT